jgi:hypothetical protein
VVWGWGGLRRAAVYGSGAGQCATGYIEARWASDPQVVLSVSRLWVQGLRGRWESAMPKQWVGWGGEETVRQCVTWGWGPGDVIKCGEPSGEACLRWGGSWTAS